MTQDPTGTGAGPAAGDAQPVAPQGGDEFADDFPPDDFGGGGGLHHMCPTRSGIS